MTTFTLGVHNLPAAETALIKTLVHLYSHDPSFQWSFAETGSFDAVVVDTTRATSSSPDNLARSVLKVTPANAAQDADSIHRPIRSEQLEAWLKRQAQQLPAHKHLSEDHKCLQISSRQCIKLQHWPSAALLKNDPQRIRLATLLARRAMSVSELGQLSHLPEGQCWAFVETLHQAGLIQVQEMARPVTAAPPTAQTHLTPEPSHALGLIASIRRRLGLAFGSH